MCVERDASKTIARAWAAWKADRLRRVVMMNFHRLSRNPFKTLSDAMAVVQRCCSQACTLRAARVACGLLQCGTAVQGHTGRLPVLRPVEPGRERAVDCMCPPQGELVAPGTEAAGLWHFQHQRLGGEVRCGVGASCRREATSRAAPAAVLRGCVQAGSDWWCEVPVASTCAAWQACWYGPLVR